HRRHYTPRELALIRRMHPTAPVRVIAQALGRKDTGVEQKVAQMGLRRTPEQQAAIIRARPRPPSITKHERAARRIEAELYDLAALEREAQAIARERATP